MVASPAAQPICHFIGYITPSPDTYAAVLLCLQAHIEQSNRAWWPIQLLNRWLSIRLELTGAVIVFICAVAVSVLVPRNAGLAGLALTSALNLTGTLAWMVRQTTELEVNMNSGGRHALLSCSESFAPNCTVASAQTCSL
jgi:hypothetical protein